ncbi:hypothetical protein DFH07DRAFT_784540 [Mycena maculata]|uniref:Uncharacterized protein n=1 Tax=Mycena maculata TaxID=230809 RepID=A0AAD7HGM3_9AGAR|nr:hypothetical protein DFH07DRAFT_784540 [Mycena maculata]
MSNQPRRAVLLRARARLVLHLLSWSVYVSESMEGGGRRTHKSHRRAAHAHRCAPSTPRPTANRKDMEDGLLDNRLPPQHGAVSHPNDSSALCAVRSLRVTSALSAREATFVKSFHESVSRFARRSRCHVSKSNRMERETCTTCAFSVKSKRNLPSIPPDAQPALVPAAPEAQALELAPLYVLPSSLRESSRDWRASTRTARPTPRPIHLRYDSAYRGAPALDVAQWFGGPATKRVSNGAMEDEGKGNDEERKEAMLKHCSEERKEGGTVAMEVGSHRSANDNEEVREVPQEKEDVDRRGRQERGSRGAKTRTYRAREHPPRTKSIPPDEHDPHRLRAAGKTITTRRGEELAAPPHAPPRPNAEEKHHQVLRRPRRLKYSSYAKPNTLKLSTLGRARPPPRRGRGGGVERQRVQPEEERREDAAKEGGHPSFRSAPWRSSFFRTGQAFGDDNIPTIQSSTAFPSDHLLISVLCVLLQTSRTADSKWDKVTHAVRAALKEILGIPRFGARPEKVSSETTRSFFAYFLPWQVLDLALSLLEASHPAVSQSAPLVGKCEKSLELLLKYYPEHGFRWLEFLGEWPKILLDARAILNNMNIMDAVNTSLEEKASNYLKTIEATGKTRGNYYNIEENIRHAAWMFCAILKVIDVFGFASAFIQTFQSGKYPSTLDELIPAFEHRARALHLNLSIQELERHVIAAGINISKLAIGLSLAISTSPLVLLCPIRLYSLNNTTVEVLYWVWKYYGNHDDIALSRWESKIWHAVISVALTGQSIADAWAEIVEREDPSQVPVESDPSWAIFRIPKTGESPPFSGEHPSPVPSISAPPPSTGEHPSSAASISTPPPTGEHLSSAPSISTFSAQSGNSESTPRPTVSHPPKSLPTLKQKQTRSTTDRAKRKASSQGGPSEEKKPKRNLKRLSKNERDEDLSDEWDNNSHSSENNESNPPDERPETPGLDDMECDSGMILKSYQQKFSIGLHNASVMDLNVIFYGTQQSQSQQYSFMTELVQLEQMPTVMSSDPVSELQDPPSRETHPNFCLHRPALWKSASSVVGEEMFLRMGLRLDDESFHMEDLYYSTALHLHVVNRSLRVFLVDDSAQRLHLLNTPVQSVDRINPLSYLDTGERAETQCRNREFGEQRLPTDMREWVTAAMAQVRTQISFSPMATVLVAESGERVVWIATGPMDVITALQSVSCEQDIVKRFSWQAVLLSQGNSLYLPANVLYTTFVTKTSLLRGHCFISTSTILDTICGACHKAPAEIMIHGPLLARIFCFWSFELQAAEYRPQVSSPSPHLPNFKNWKDVYGMMMLGNFVLLSQALDERSYRKPTISRDDRNDAHSACCDVVTFRKWFLERYIVACGSPPTQKLRASELFDLLPVYHASLKWRSKQDAQVPKAFEKKVEEMLEEYMPSLTHRYQFMNLRHDPLPPTSLVPWANCDYKVLRADGRN